MKSVAQIVVYPLLYRVPVARHTYTRPTPIYTRSLKLLLCTACSYSALLRVTSHVSWNSLTLNDLLLTYIAPRSPFLSKRNVLFRFKATKPYFSIHQNLRLWQFRYILRSGSINVDFSRLVSIVETKSTTLGETAVPRSWFL